MTRTCYSTDPGPYGWCGTCYEEKLKPDQEGYCDYFGGCSILYLDLIFFVLHMKHFLLETNNTTSPGI